MAIRLDVAYQNAYEGKAHALRLWADTVDLPHKRSEALAAAEKALELNPRDATARAIRATILAELDRHAEAISDFDMALNLDPTNGWARKEKAKALYFHGDLEAALDVFRELQEKNHEFLADALTGQVLTLRSLERAVNANERFGEIVGPSVDANEALEQGRRFVELRAWEDARTKYQEAIRKDPSLGDAHNELAWYQATKLQRDLDDCNVHAMIAVELAPDPYARGNYLDTLGWVRYKRGELEEAQESLEEAVRLAQPDNTLMRHHLEVVKQARTAAQGTS